MKYKYSGANTFQELVGLAIFITALFQESWFLLVASLIWMFGEFTVIHYQGSNIHDK